MCESAAKPTSPATAEDAEAVTPEMEEIGLQVLYAAGVVENPIAMTDRWLVRRLFLAMAALQPLS